jgi:8-oxo-dGTP pyrophosphatase MutT (NUDIX family)
VHGRTVATDYLHSHTTPYKNDRPRTDTQRRYSQRPSDTTDCGTLVAMNRREATTAEAAADLGIGVPTLQRWAKARKVRPAFITAGGQYRWDIDDLRRQLAPADEDFVQPVVAVIVTSRAGVLVGQRNDGKPPWTFIAGEIEPEEDPADAAVREVKEETGLDIRPGRILGTRVHPATGRVMLYMTGEPVGPTDIFVGDRAELAEVRWVTLGEAEQLMPGMFGPVRHWLSQHLAAA